MNRILGFVNHRAMAAGVSLEHTLDDTAAADNRGIDAPLGDREAGFAIGLRGRPRLATEPYDPSTIGAKVLSLYREKGAACLSLLRGPFALAIIDKEPSRALIAIDRMGVERLCWGLKDGRLVFGTSAADVARMLDTRGQLNRQALFGFMLGHMVAAPDTVYAGVNKLVPGTYLSFDGGRVALGRFWEPPFGHRPKSQAAVSSERLVPVLRSAVRACEPGVTTGAFLSGGLDSSTVTGLLAETRGTATPAFSVGFGVDQYDELAYARIAVRHFGCRHYEYQVTSQDIVEQIPRIAAAYDEPFGNSSAVPTFCCARLAKSHGIDHLLAGDGGDELFGGNERYVRQRIFDLYYRLPRWARVSLIDPIAARLDPETGLLPLRKLSSYVRQARVPLPERFETWNLIYREGPERVFTEDFLASVDTDYPLRRMRETWDSCPSDDLLDRMLWYDWKYTLADNDLRKVSVMCELAGVRVSYPMLDEDLVDLSIEVPSAAKISGTELRSFYKRALREFLPTEIIKKQKHGFGLPFGVWLKTDSALQDLVYGSLEGLKARDIIAHGFIDRVVAEHRQGHASYYGYAIWDLVMLEHWLCQSAAPARPVSAI